MGSEGPEVEQVAAEPARPRAATDSNSKQPFLIGIAGGTASGKTTVCQRIIQALGDQSVTLLSLDEFYHGKSEETDHHEINFDEPAAFDVPTALRVLDTLKKGEAVEVPIYDFVTSTRRKDATRHVNAADVVVLEGILTLAIPEIVQRCNMRIFVDTDDDVRLARRIKRDTLERGRTVDSVLSQYVRFVKPAFEKWVLPSKQCADIIIPWLNDNSVAVNLITEHIRSKLQIHDLRRVYPSLFVMPSTMQTRGMHTKIRNRRTPRTDFVFYADRLIKLIVEFALGMLPFEPAEVTTPCGSLYQGLKFCSSICGVSIIRSGEAMENALRACCYGIKIGKILIHRNGSDSKQDFPQTLVYEKLPHDIATRHVLLMDPILATGNSATKAIEVLTQRRGVDESKIILLTLIAAPPGIHKVCSMYPKLQVITTEIDEGLSADGQVLPGVGDFGDRYFGTCSAADESLAERPARLDSKLNDGEASST